MKSIMSRMYNEAQGNPIHSGLRFSTFALRSSSHPWSGNPSARFEHISTPQTLLFESICYPWYDIDSAHKSEQCKS